MDTEGINPQARPWMSSVLIQKMPSDHILGINPQAGAPRRKPPLSAPRFVEQFLGKHFAPHEEKVRQNLEIFYRFAIEDGFNSLERLSYGKLSWSDSDVSELASCFMEVPLMAAYRR